MKTLWVLILAIGLLLHPQASVASDDAGEAEAASTAGSDETETADAEDAGAAVADTDADDADADVAADDAATEDEGAGADAEDAQAAVADADAETPADADAEDETAVADADAETATDVADDTAGAVATEPAIIDPAPTEDAPEAVPSTEEPAEVAAADTDDATEDADDDEKASGRPWSLTAGHNFGFGLQIDEATHYYYGQLSVSGSHRIHGALRARASAGIHYTPDPRPNDARRFDMGGVSLGLAHGNLFHDETFTDIRVSGQATVALPLSMGGRASGNYPTVGAGVSLARSVGPVNFSYGLNFNKFNPKSNVRYLPLCAEDRGDVSSCIGGYETNWQLGHRFGASYTTPIEGLSVSANFGTTLTRTYGPAQHDPAMSPEYMHHVRANVRDGFGFGLSASYRILDSLSASLSFSNGGSWRSNGQDLYNPLFDPRLAAMSVGVSYTY